MEEEEYVIESGGEDVDFEFKDGLCESQDTLLSVFNTYTAVMYGAPATLSSSGEISLSIPRTFLPLSVQASYGFMSCKSLLDIDIMLDVDSWSLPPRKLSIKNEKQGANYIGRALVDTTCREFFSPAYKPRPSYRCEPYLLTPTGQADTAKLEQLVKAGYNEQKAKNALVLCGNDEEQAVQFLRTGEMKAYQSQIVTGYNECPLLYLVLEIAECFIDLSDHCCICRKSLEPGVRPSVCDNTLCNFQFSQLGIGNSVSQELKNDPDVADLVISLFATALETDYLTPAPPKLEVASMHRIIDELPTVRQMAAAPNDAQLRAQIGESSFELLRWILLSNRSHLIRLHDQMLIGPPNMPQFMTLISAPEAEREFKKLKAQYGSMLLLHGSRTNRWHSIIRNGLKNASGTKLQANGAAYGPGIYLASHSGISLFYSCREKNKYPNSCLPAELKVLAVCEVAKDPTLRLASTNIYTLGNERAVICRFLIIVESDDVNTVNKILQTEHMPSLKDVLNYEAERAQKPVL